MSIDGLPVTRSTGEYHKYIRKGTLIDLLHNFTALYVTLDDVFKWKIKIPALVADPILILTDTEEKL